MTRIVWEGMQSIQLISGNLSGCAHSWVKKKWCSSLCSGCFLEELCLKMIDLWQTMRILVMAGGSTPTLPLVWGIFGVKSGTSQSAMECPTSTDFELDAAAAGCDGCSHGGVHSGFPGRKRCLQPLGLWYLPAAVIFFCKFVFSMHYW